MTQPSRSTLSRPGDRGFTLIEIVLALALYGIVALLVTLMLVGVGSTTSAENDMRHAIIKRQVATARLGSLMRSASVVLAADASCLVLWTGDADGNSKPNLSELRGIIWDDALNEIRTAESPPDLNSTSDDTFELTADFLTIVRSRAGSALFPERVVLQGVFLWTVELDNAVTHSARTIRADVALDADDEDDVAAVIATLRVESEIS